MFRISSHFVISLRLGADCTALLFCVPAGVVSCHHQSVFLACDGPVAEPDPALHNADELILEHNADELILEQGPTTM